MSVVAQLDHHDLLSTTGLLGTELTCQDAVPTVAGHYAMVST
jgi:hypothetical protein